MQSSSRDLTFILQMYFPPDISSVRTLYILTEGLEEKEAKDTSSGMLVDIELLYELLGITPETVTTPPSLPLPPLVLCTTCVECIRCEAVEPCRSLRRCVYPQNVKVLTSGLRWREATLHIAHCKECRADYYPDSFTYPIPNTRLRRQQFEYSPRYLRVSKQGIWVERRSTWIQEHAIKWFRAGWSNLAGFINDLLPEKPLLMNRQAQCLFLEHFSRRLLIAHGKHKDFSFPAHPNSAMLAETVRECLGANGGSLLSTLYHGCTEYLEHEGALPQEVNPKGIDEQLAAVPDGQQPIQGMPPKMPPLPNIHQAVPEVGRAHGYVRLAVMDVKTITHDKCAFDDCRNPLVDYHSGRFCSEHLEAQNICGIVGCGQPVEPGEVTCDLDAHRTWHSQWEACFSRQSYDGVQRVIQKQKQAPANAEGGGHRPTLHVELPALDGTLGNEVVHTFCAKTTYCLETIQWACRMPIGWGKCYKSESSSQVLDFLNRTWPVDYHHLCPGFIGFDNACDLLHHVVTQNPADTWIDTTKFIVDAWHYIGHKATDILCRRFCNPMPTDGSQPDLVGTAVDANNQTHLVQAFNTETAEHFNAWLSGYEGLMVSMTDVNYDFFVHVLFLIHSEVVEERMRKDNQELDEEFWNRAEEEM
ncbi:hypothetical protein V8D89_002078 [Ganoderma adspersum]